MPDSLTEIHKRLTEMERRIAMLERIQKAYGWQLGCIHDMHRFGGGKLRWAWRASYAKFDQGDSGDSSLTENNITDANYGVTTYGGPWIELDGINEYLSDADASWQEPGTEEYFTWVWAYVDGTPAGGETILSKWDAQGGNLRSWRLYITAAPAPFYFNWTCNNTGAAAGSVTVTSTVPIVDDTWYFVGAYLEPNITQNIYVGAQDDPYLTETVLAVGVPAGLFDGAASFKIGAITGGGGVSDYWDGKIGVCAGWTSIAAANIDDFANMLFQNTLQFYED